MPIKIVEGLPVAEHLRSERVSLIETGRALTQDIRPLKILILNLMPKKEETELQLLRLLGNTPLQIDVDFMYMNSHLSKNTPKSYLQKFYYHYDEIRDERFDGLIITGAPVEHLEFSEVDYSKELNQVMKWSETHVFSRFYICWAAQYALNYYFDIEKIPLSEKLFGIFQYKNNIPSHKMLRGFDEYYHVPQSRHTRVDYEQIEKIPELIKLTEHPEYGPDILITQDQRDIFVFGHLEYDRNTLNNEYQRDLARGDDIQMPKNYFPTNDPTERPIFNWKSHAYILYNNWLNQTYQNTPYDLDELVTLKR